MTISALIHTRNEEANLPGCLASVTWADEVVVADMASTDATRALAMAHGARLLDMPVAPVVEPVRNRAVAQCQGDWILVVDADERVAPKLTERLRALATANEADAYALPRRNYFLGVWLEHGFWPDFQTRFFRKGAVTWPDTVHEPPAVRGTLRELPVDAEAALEHPGYGNDLQRFLEKIVAYSPLEARRLAATTAPPAWPYLVRRPLGEFYGRYVAAQAWRHGMHGLAWSLLQAGYQLLTAMHYWASHRPPAAEDPAASALQRRVRWELVRFITKWLIAPASPGLTPRRRTGHE